MLAIYPPVWSARRGSALRTVLLTEAIATTLGASLLVWGDDRGCLQHPYYPDYQRLTADEGEQVLRWHRYALRCRDLFACGTDTSWSDIGDENGAVSVRWTAAGGVDGAVLPEPAGGAVYARVVRQPDCVAISVLDLTGSPAGSWQAPTDQGTCRQVSVTVLLAEPGRWTAAAAVLGRDGDRFHAGRRGAARPPGRSRRRDRPAGRGRMVSTSAAPELTPGRAAGRGRSGRTSVRLVRRPGANGTGGVLRSNQQISQAL